MTFWNRLIPDDQRAKVPDRKKKGSNAGEAEPSARTARRNNAAQSEAGKGPLSLVHCQFVVFLWCPQLLAYRIFLLQS